MIQNKNISLEHFAYQLEGNIVSDMGSEKVMLSIENGKYYNLGQIGGDIWELLNEQDSIKKIIDSLMKEYEVDYAECQEQVLSFLKSLQKEGLIKIEEDALS